MKAYILIKESVPLGFAMVAAAHAGTILGMSDNEMAKAWRNGVFRKCLCKVSASEFEAAKQSPLIHTILTESALDYQEVAIVFMPQIEWPKEFRFYQLYK